MSVRALLPTLLLAAAPSAAAAAEPTREAIAAVIRAVRVAEDNKDFGLLRAVTWPEGTFSVVGRDPQLATKRKWDRFIFSGMGVSTRTIQASPRISVSGNTAVVRVRETGQFLYDHKPSGGGFNADNVVRLERRNGQWRVLDWARTVQHTGARAKG